jgi:hypothetical protein
VAPSARGLAAFEVTASIHELANAGGYPGIKMTLEHYGNTVFRTVTYILGTIHNIVVGGGTTHVAGSSSRWLRCSSPITTPAHFHVVLSSFLVMVELEALLGGPDALVPGYHKKRIP